MWLAGTHPGEMVRLYCADGARSGLQIRLFDDNFSATGFQMNRGAHARRGVAHSYCLTAALEAQVAF